MNEVNEMDSRIHGGIHARTSRNGRGLLVRNPLFCTGHVRRFIGGERGRFIGIRIQPNFIFVRTWRAMKAKIYLAIIVIGTILLIAVAILWK